MGDQIGYVALITLVYQTTGRSGSVGLLMMLQAVPGMLLGVAAGSLVDRATKKRSVMVAADVAQFLLTGLLAFSTHRWQVYGLAVGKAVAASFFMPAKNALLRRLLREETIRPGLALAAVLGQATQVLGPTVAGACILWADVKAALLVDAVTFLVSAVLCILVSETPPPQGNAAVRKRTALWRDAWEGLQALRSHPVLRIVATMELTALVGVGAVNALFVAYVVKVLGWPASSFGLLLTLLGIGMVTGSLIAGSVSKQVTSASLGAWSLVGIGATVVAVGLAKGAVVALPVFVLMGCLNGLYNVASTSALQELTAADMVGRTFGTMGTVQSVVAVASMAAGSVLADTVAVEKVFVLAGLIVGAGGLFGLLSLRRRQPMEIAERVV